MSKSLNLNDFLGIDALTVKVDDDPQKILNLFESLGFFVESSCPKFGYRYSYDIYKDVEKFAWLQCGGDNVGDTVFIQSMGFNSGELKKIIHDNYSKYETTRIDIKLDLDGAHTFDVLAQQLFTLAKQKNLKVNMVGDWKFKKSGRTLYIGSRASVYYLRLYEKHLQPNFLPDDFNTEIVRLEVEIKPHKKFRFACSDYSLIELLGSCDWVKNIYEFAYCDLKENVNLRGGRSMSSYESALKQLKKQYKNTLLELLNRHNGCMVGFASELLDFNDNE